MARHVLSRLGHEVLIADSAEAALRVFSGHPQTVDLLLTDLHMPGMSGRQLAEAVRRLKPDLPILYMSGDALASIYADERLPPGMFFLAKPYSPGTLAAAVEEARNWRTN